MSPWFSGLLLTALCVHLWRVGAVTKTLERRRSKKQTDTAAFWIAYTPKRTGTSSSTTVMAKERCEAGCGREVTYRWLRAVDAASWELCAHDSAKAAKQLTVDGFDLWLLVDTEAEATA